jgi:hypothetical protein
VVRVEGRLPAARDIAPEDRSVLGRDWPDNLLDGHDNVVRRVPE